MLPVGALAGVLSAHRALRHERAGGGLASGNPRRLAVSTRRGRRLRAGADGAVRLSRAALSRGPRVSCRPARLVPGQLLQNAIRLATGLGTFPPVPPLCATCASRL